MNSQLYNDIKTIEALNKIADGIMWLMTGEASNADMQQVWGKMPRIALLPVVEQFDQLREIIWRRLDPTMFYEHTCDDCMTKIEDPATHVCEGL